MLLARALPSPTPARRSRRVRHSKPQMVMVMAYLLVLHQPSCQLVTVGLLQLVHHQSILRHASTAVAWRCSTCRGSRESLDVAHGSAVRALVGGDGIKAGDAKQSRARRKPGERPNLCVWAKQPEGEPLRKPPPRGRRVPPFLLRVSASLCLGVRDRSTGRSTYRQQGRSRAAKQEELGRSQLT